MEGLIVRAQSGFYTVALEDGATLTCRLRGRLKRGPRLGDVAAVGDRVEVMPLGNGEGAIEAILPRTRLFSRLSPRPSGVYQQILLANPDQGLFVFACANPTPHLGMLDRYLVSAERQHLPAVVVANKVDLVGLAAAQALFEHYRELGYPVIYTSVKARIGLEDLRAQLTGKLSFVTGPSGVGKSTLLNALQPGLGLAVQGVSESNDKGRHTTVVRQLYPLDGGGYVADTPGLKAFALYDIEPEELDGYFPELRARVELCGFNDCTHTHEPDCAVLAALAAGEIHPDRYRSYRRMRYGDVEAETDEG